MKILASILFSFFTIISVAQKNSKLLVGTYTNGFSEGIYVYNFNSKTGNSILIDSAKTSNPSFLAISPNKKFVYAVNEEGDSINNGGMVSAFSINKKGKLSFINAVASGGNHPCFIRFDKTGKWAIAGNYSGGSFSILPVNKNGSVLPAKTIIQHYGKSINKSRQESAHVHATQLSEDNKFLLVSDLGIDKLMVYNFDEINGTVAENTSGSVSVSAGSGPRHIAFHPSQKMVYLTQELNGTVAVFSFLDKGQLKLLQTISALPVNYKGSFGGADIHVSADGKFLYASNRGESNTIVIYAIDPMTGILSLIGHQSTLGIKPRNFNFDPTGNFLLVANQDSNDIVIFKIDHQTGLLTDTGLKINVPNPVCIQWIE